MALVLEGYRVDMALTDCYSMVVHICIKMACCYAKLCTALLVLCVMTVPM